jgi:hypothetical protein
MFVEKYSTFLSSFVLGLAGLIGTGLYQHEQTKISNEQAKASIEVSKNKAETDWKIARAEILSKNLQVLLTKGEDTVDQRFGVLLSLTREDIMDPELAMSYAFDLNNADYIKSVILNIQRKNYAQIFNNFRLTCDLRYGVWRDTQLCKDADKKYEARARAIPDVVSEELGRSGVKEGPTPYSLLVDDKQVHAHLMRIVYLFSPYLRDVLDRQRLSDIATFEARSPSARLVAAFALAGDATGGQSTSDQTGARAKFHLERQQRLEKLLVEPACDFECRGQAVELLLNGLPEYGAAYAAVLRRVLSVRGPELEQVVTRLHARLLWCQVDKAAVDRLVRDVLVPLYLAETSTPPPAKKGERERAGEAVLDLLAMVDLPADVKLPEAAAHALEPRRARARKERESPPQRLRSLNFCGARGEESTTASEEDL